MRTFCPALGLKVFVLTVTSVMESRAESAGGPGDWGGEGGAPGIRGGAEKAVGLRRKSSEKAHNVRKPRLFILLLPCLAQPAGLFALSLLSYLAHAGDLLHVLAVAFHLPDLHFPTFRGY